jgi:hypothetical protein
VNILSSGITGHDMVQVVWHWPHQGGPVHVGFVIDRVTMGQVFSKYFSFPINIILQMFSMHLCLSEHLKSCRYQ